MIFFVTVGGKSSSYGLFVCVTTFKMKLKCLSSMLNPNENRWANGYLYLEEFSHWISCFVSGCCVPCIIIHNVCTLCYATINFLPCEISWDWEVTKIYRKIRNSASTTCKYVKENSAHMQTFLPKLKSRIFSFSFNLVSKYRCNLLVWSWNASLCSVL